MNKLRKLSVYTNDLVKCKKMGIEFTRGDLFTLQTVHAELIKGIEKISFKRENVYCLLTLLGFITQVMGNDFIVYNGDI
jgi:hypothetical protein